MPFWGRFAIGVGVGMVLALLTVFFVIMPYVDNYYLRLILSFAAGFIFTQISILIAIRNG